MVANLSRFAQHVELNLSALRGQVPAGAVRPHRRSPPSATAPTPLSLGPHGFYWFSLRPESAGVAAPGRGGPASRRPSASRTCARRAATTPRAPRSRPCCPQWLATRPWFRGQARSGSRRRGRGRRARVRRRQHPGWSGWTTGRARPRPTLAPLAPAWGQRADDVAARAPARRARLAGGRGGPRPCSTTRSGTASFCEGLLGVVARQRARQGDGGRGRRAAPTAASAARASRRRGSSRAVSVRRARRHAVDLRRPLRPEAGAAPGGGAEPRPGDRAGSSPSAAFAHGPARAGLDRVPRRRRSAMTLAVLQDYVPHEPDAWRHALDELGRYFERSSPRARPRRPCPPGRGDARAGRAGAPSPWPTRGSGPSCGTPSCSASAPRRCTWPWPRIAPIPPSPPSPSPPSTSARCCSRVRILTREVLQLLRRRLRDAPGARRGRTPSALLSLEAEIMRQLRASVFQRRLRAERIRYHGNYPPRAGALHGEGLRDPGLRGRPRRGPSAERRVKRSPLRDVASMIRSFHYAAAQALSGRIERRRARGGPARPRALGPALADLGLRRLPGALPGRRRRERPSRPSPRRSCAAALDRPTCSRRRSTRSATSSTRGRSGCASRSSGILELMG